MCTPLEQLKKHCEILDDEMQVKTIGGGIKYYFDNQGHVVFQESIEGDNDVISIGNRTMELSGPLGLMESSTERSGIAFDGEGLNRDVFKFLADNTSVEWAYCFTDGENGGFLATYNDEHSVGITEDPDDFATLGYDSVIHNHSQFMSGSGYELYKIKEYNGLPSEDDIEWLRSYGFPSGIIYNETNGQFESYTEDSDTQEDYVW